MKTVFMAHAMAAALALTGTAAFAQQQKVDFGKQEFEAKCASCHGVSGKGDGPVSAYMNKPTPDLTQLAKKNRGVLPTARLFEVIEGSSVPGHGTREMPVWGKDFRLEDASSYREARGAYDPAVLVRARILMLLEYIDRLQAR